MWLFKVSDSSPGKWVLRVIVRGKRREMGLGSVADIGLAEARKLAQKQRAMAKEGRDPINERKRQQAKVKAQSHLLADIAKQAFEARKADLKGGGKAGRWFSPSEVHVLPKLGEVPVIEISQTEIVDALGPIWRDKPVTAGKAINRLGICLKYAAALGLAVDLAAVDKAKALLGKTGHQTKHVPSMPWQDVPRYYETLLETPTATNLALRLLILTAARSAEVRFANLAEFSDGIWTLPAVRTKTNREHRIPLSDAAKKVVEIATQYSRDGFLFPSVRRGVIFRN